ncbi:MAG TPA: acyltransferase family protein [Acidimicrobiales bacterium]|nr:acyltransferase family protein [Acidimicrobiales bacterium]
MIDRPLPASRAASGDGPEPSSDATPRLGLTYNPALDGIRGLAVAAVLFFHGGFPWARGGYLGVSTFFTLSGFLITSLLLVEHGATGRIGLGRFWSRRLRRLLPASALTLAAVAIGSQVFDELAVAGLRGDLLASLFQVANWRFIFDDQSYAALFSSPSPVLHFWSLAIEEQFYWLFPLLTAGVFALAKGSIKVYAAVLTGLLAVSAVATVALGVEESTTVYYATYTRMGEILVGSLLAVATASGVFRSRLVGRLAAAGGVLALAASAWAWWNIEQETASVSKGGLLAYALVSAALVLSTTVPGPARALLSVEPLRLLGVVSYGVYLVHWPIFLVVDGDRTGLDRAPLFALRLAITLVVAVASYRLVERPIRRGWSLPRVPMPALAAASVAVVALTAAVVPSSAPTGMTDEDELAAYLDGIKFQDPANIPPDALLGVGFGDSTMLETGMGLSAWGKQSEDLVLPGIVGDLLGCGVTRGGERRSRGNSTVAPEGCDDWPETIPSTVSSIREQFGRLEFAIVQTGPWDVADRRLEGDDEWRAPGDPVYDDYLYRELAAATDLFVEQGLVVVWLLAPHVEVGRNEEPPPDPPYAESDPARMDRLNEIIQRVADERPSVVTVDLAGYMRGLPEGEMDPRLRPDGVHFTAETATEVADWLGPEVLAAVASEPNPAAPPPMPPAPTTTTPAS